MTDGSESRVYSKDYWDEAFEQVGRRPLAKVAIVLLALLYASAIYAPLLANDRPYVLEAIDYQEYAKSRRTMYAVALGARGAIQRGEAAFLEGLSDEARIRTWSAKLRADERALRGNLATMRRYLSADDQGALDELEAAFTRAIDAALENQSEEASDLADAARDLAATIRSEYAAVGTGDDVESGGTKLIAYRAHPLLESTTSLEVFFMWLWALVLTWPVWNGLVNRFVLRRDRERVRRWRRIKWTCVVGSSAVAALVWALAGDGRMTFETGPYKQGLTSGEIVATHLVAPPIWMGFAETHMAERFRPPTWHATSDISEEGRYVRGARAEVDESTGMLPPALPVEVRLGEAPRNSAWRHPLGTDSVGRDQLVRILYGGRISLAVGILSTALLVVIGVIAGAIAGYFGGMVDTLISRVIEIFQSFPAFFLILTAVTMIPDDRVPPIFAIVFFIAIVRWTGVARLVRGEFLRLREQEFVVSARALGFSNARVIFRHVLPNALGPVLVAASFSVAAGILTESAISFLGLGIKLPIPSWGSLLNDARGAGEYWWLQIFPGLLIFVTVFCYNILGEGVRDALDPKRRV